MSKKAKFDFASFDFDSLPAFEPLEDTLVLLRNDPYNASALDKLLNMDIGELVDHPQWDELLDLLKPVLYCYTDVLVTDSVYYQVLRLHSLYLSSPLSSHQTLDVVNQLLDMLCHIFLWDAHMAGNVTGTPASMIGEPGLSSVSCPGLTLLLEQVVVLMKVVEVISTPAVIGNDNHRVDAIKAAIFALLAHGSVPLADSSGGAGIGVSLFDCVLWLSLNNAAPESTWNGASFAADLNLALTSWSTCNSTTSTGILALAYQTGFISLLVARVERPGDISGSTLPLDALIYSSCTNILLHLILNFADCSGPCSGNVTDVDAARCCQVHRICHVCTRSAAPIGSGTYVWDSRVAVESALSGSPVSPVRLSFKRLIPLEFIPKTNKKFQQVVGLDNLLFDLLLQPRSEISGASLVGSSADEFRYFLEQIILNLSTVATGMNVFAEETGGLLLCNVISDILQSLLNIIVVKSVSVAAALMKPFGGLYCSFLSMLLENAADWRGQNSVGARDANAVREQLVDVVKDLLGALVRVTGEQQQVSGSAGDTASLPFLSLWVPVLKQLCLCLRAAPDETESEEQSIRNVMVQFVLFHEAKRPSDVEAAVLLGVCNAVATVLRQVARRCVVLGITPDVTTSALLDMSDEANGLVDFFCSSCEFYTIVYNQLDSSSCCVDVSVLHLLSCSVLHTVQLLPSLACLGEGGALVAYLAEREGARCVHHIAPVSILYYLLSSYINAVKIASKRLPQHGVTHLLVGITDALATFPDESLNCIMQVADHISVLLGDQLINGDIDLFAASHLGGEDCSVHGSANTLWCVMELLYSMISLGWVNEAVLIFLRAVKSHCLMPTDSGWALVDHVLVSGDSIALLMHLLFDEYACGDTEMTDETVLAWSVHGFYLCLLRLYSVAMNNIAFVNAVREQFLVHLTSYEANILSIGVNRGAGAASTSLPSAWLSLLYENCLAIVSSSSADSEECDDGGNGGGAVPVVVDETFIWKQSVLVRLVLACPTASAATTDGTLPRLRDCELFLVLSGAAKRRSPPLLDLPPPIAQISETTSYPAGICCLLATLDDAGDALSLRALRAFVVRHKTTLRQTSKPCDNTAAGAHSENRYPLQATLLCDHLDAFWPGSYEELERIVISSWNPIENVAEGSISGETALMQRWLALNIRCAGAIVASELSCIDDPAFPPAPPGSGCGVASAGILGKDGSQYETMEARVLKLLVQHTTCNVFHVCSHFGVNVRILMRLVLPNWFGSVLDYRSIMRLTATALLDLPGGDIDTIGVLVAGAICCHVCEGLVLASTADHRRGMEAVVGVLGTSPISLSGIKPHVWRLAKLL